MQLSKRQMLAFFILGALVANTYLQLFHAQRRGYVTTSVVRPLNRYGVTHCIWKYLKRTAVFWFLFLFLIFTQPPHWLDKLASVLPFGLIIVLSLCIYGLVMGLKTYHVFFMVWSYRAFAIWALSGLAVYNILRSKEYSYFFSALLTFLAIDSAGVLYELFRYPVMPGYDVFHHLSVFGLSAQYFTLISFTVLAIRCGILLNWRHCLVGGLAFGYVLGWAISPHVFSFPRVSMAVFFVLLTLGLPRNNVSNDR